MDVTLQGLTDLIPAPWRTVLLPYPDEWRFLTSKLSEDARPFTPQFENIFSALRIPPEAVRVVILGQDPYPSQGDAHGLAFSVEREGSLPPSLRNIFTEYESDLNLPRPATGDLSSWVDQGVLLLNTVLTCAVGEPQSHSDYGWQFFSELIVQRVAENNPVAILWGKSAERFSNHFSKESVLVAPHPSPLSAYRGFFGSKPFTSVNRILNGRGEQTINWSLQNV